MTTVLQRFPVKRYTTNARGERGGEVGINESINQTEVTMSNEFRGTGNVGDQPVLKTVLVGNEERQVAELRVFFDEYRQDGKGGLEQAGGFWLDVNVWGERHAAEVEQLVKKGARVHVIGRLAESKWTVTATGEERRALYLNADRLFLSLARLAEARFKPRREAPESRA